MMKPLLVGDFEWMEEKELEKWKNFPCILEVDLEYPKKIHDLHNDYPLAPERLKIEDGRFLLIIRLTSHICFCFCGLLKYTFVV